jgi:HK97 family phage major capsid protein
MSNFGILTTDGKDFADSTAGSSGGSQLIPRTLFSELIDDVKKNLIMRALASRVIGPSSIPGSSIVLTLQEKDTMTVDRINQGGEILMDVENYSTITVEPRKYGVRIGITKEMIEDSQWDVMSMNIKTAAYELADNEDALVITELDTASGLTDGTRVANSNATLPLTDVTAAMQGLEEEYFTPTDMVVGVEVANDIRNIDEFNSKDYGDNSIAKRLVGRVWGMNVIVSHNVTAQYAYVIDRDHAFVIVEKRPVTIERYFDAARDSNFAVVTQRVAASYLRPGAVARIVTT